MFLTNTTQEVMEVLSTVAATLEPISF
ncbi:hypothetical protein EMIT0158MI4_90189 [Burkholderia ambifaria]